MKKLLVAGLGLIGGSIAKASRGYFDEIYGFNHSEKSLRAAEAEGVILQGFLCPEDCPKDIDLVCLCTPVSAMVPLAQRLYAAGCGKLFTDGGSTKADIVAGMTAEGIPFVGGHPMAGKEHSGYAFSSPELFAGANWVLTPANQGEELSFLTDWIRHMGARPLVMDAREHDRAAAAISHLPHIVASALTQVAGEEEKEISMVRNLAAGGFLDITRIASSDPTMWQNIFLQNKQPVLDMLRSLRNILSQWEDMLEREDGQAMWDRFAATKALRDSYKKEFAEKAEGREEA